MKMQVYARDTSTLYWVVAASAEAAAEQVHLLADDEYDGMEGRYWVHDGKEWRAYSVTTRVTVHHEVHGGERVPAPAAVEGMTAIELE